MSHEKTITIDIEGNFYNIPSVRGGKQLSNKEAADYAIKKQSLGTGYKSLKEATDAAKKRSKSFDKGHK